MQEPPLLPEERVTGTAYVAVNMGWAALTPFEANQRLPLQLAACVALPGMRTSETVGVFTLRPAGELHHPTDSFLFLSSHFVKS